MTEAPSNSASSVIRHGQRATLRLRMTFPERLKMKLITVRVIPGLVLVISEVVAFIS